MKLVKYNSDCYRILDDETIQAFALKMADGSWGLYDKDEKRLIKITFPSPKNVKEYYETVWLNGWQ